MGTGLTLEYSQEADVLCILNRPAYIGQEAEEIADLVIARMNPQTWEIEYLEILLLLRLLGKYGKLVLPVDAALFLANAEAMKTPSQSSPLDATLTIKYDGDTDTLAIDLCEPYAEQNPQEIDSEDVARLNPETGEIENLEIRGFKARAERDGAVVLPVSATLRPVKQAVSAE